MQPPAANKVLHPHILHDDIRPDDYYWLRERHNPQVTQYLQAENAYLEAQMGHTALLQEKLYQEMLWHIQQTDLEVPVQHGPYFYYSRTEESKQYKIHCRKKTSSRAELEQAPEEIILDLNQLAEGKAYLSVTLLKPSPDHKLLAYLQNEDGSDRYTVYLKNLETGQLLPDRMDGVYLVGSLEWDAGGQYLFYVLIDAAQRPYQLYRHKLGAIPFTDPLLYEESDQTFRLYITQSRSGEYLFSVSDSTLTTEVRYLETARPEGEWKVFAPRVRGIEYSIEHHGERFLVLTNENAQNFKLLSAPTANPAREHWQELIPHRPQVYLQNLHPFAHHWLISGREDGLTQIWVYEVGSTTTRKLSFEEPVYTLAVGDNRMFETDTVLLAYQSLVTPRMVLEVDLAQRQTKVLKQDPVPGYNPQRYQSKRVWATARDGTKVPISLVYKDNALDGGPAPMLLIGYGSYGFSYDPPYNSNWLPLLDRGMIVGIAHIRGGAEMGRAWYESGKLLSKKNTFTDFIDCALHLVQSGYIRPEQLAISGRSAGGLLMGAVVNLHPDLFKAVVAGVPFVDVMTTMSDASIPLTVGEWDEWGNPQNPEYYAYMKSYSPYDNVEAKAYPHMLVTTGLNDPRVAYWEPAKWVARLRELKTDANTLLLKTHMGAGHGGSSGRYDRLKETALEYAFILDKLGVQV